MKINETITSVTFDFEKEVLPLLEEKFPEFAMVFGKQDFDFAEVLDDTLEIYFAGD